MKSPVELASLHQTLAKARYAIEGRRREVWVSQGPHLKSEGSTTTTVVVFIDSAMRRKGEGEEADAISGATPEATLAMWIVGLMLLRFTNF